MKKEDNLSTKIDLTNIKVIFFDMGNTLIHFHYGKSDDEKDMCGLQHLTKYLKEFNSEISFEQVKNDFYSKWMSHMDLRKKNLTEYPIENFLNDFMGKYNITLSHDQCVKAIHLFYTDYKKHLFVEEKLHETLKKLKEKGYKIGVISNTCYYEEVIIDCFKIKKIHGLIDDFTFSYYLQICKPDHRIFKEALKKLNISPTESLMVGDNILYDIKPALELGMKGIWLNRDSKENQTDIIPHIEISSLNEINDYI